MKTSELIGPALDWAVAYAKLGKSHAFSSSDIKGWAGVNTPSTSWAQGGPIIEREGIELMCGLTEDMAARFKSADPHWSAFPFGRPDVLNKRYLGPTPLIAAMRCFVASKLGDEVGIPEELL